jgi:hypothetical protein
VPDLYSTPSKPLTRHAPLRYRWGHPQDNGANVRSDAPRPDQEVQLTAAEQSPYLLPSRVIVVDPDRGPFGGLPERLRPDNGLGFATISPSG